MIYGILFSTPCGWHLSLSLSLLLWGTFGSCRCRWCRRMLHCAAKVPSLGPTPHHHHRPEDVSKVRKLRLIDWTHSIPAFPSTRQQSVQTNQTNKFGNGVPLVRFVIHLDNLIAASIDHRSFSLSSSSLMGPASQRRKKGWQLRFFKPGGWRSCRFLVRRSVMRPEGDIRCCQGG